MPALSLRDIEKDVIVWGTDATEGELARVLRALQARDVAALGVLAKTWRLEPGSELLRLYAEALRKYARWRGVVV